MKAVGIDIEEISRFENKTLEKDLKFLHRIFTKNEIEYCFKYKNPSSHLAVRFCAKEAAVKALCNLKNKKISLNKIEILNRENGVPCLKILDDEFKDLNFQISLSHEKSKAIAIVIIV